MQINLFSRLVERVVLTRAEPPSTVPGAWRDSAISQLEALAEANQRAAAQSRRRWAAGAVTLSGAAVLLGVTLWRPAAVDAPHAFAPTAAAAPQPAPAPSPVPVAPTEAAVGAVGVATVAAAAAEGPIATAPEPVPVVAKPADDAARQARVARRKAAQLAQERVRAEAEAQQRLHEQVRAQEAERERQLALEAARQRSAAAEQARLQALQAARDARRHVRDICAAAGGFFAEQFCQTRECRKPEHAGDAVCVRLREIELAQLRQGADH